MDSTSGNNPAPTSPQPQQQPSDVQGTGDAVAQAIVEGLKAAAAESPEQAMQREDQRDAMIADLIDQQRQARTQQPQGESQDLPTDPPPSR